MKVQYYQTILPYQLFSPAKAEEVAAGLRDDEDGWEYRVKHDPSGKGYSFIEVFDESGHCIGKL